MDDLHRASCSTWKKAGIQMKIEDPYLVRRRMVLPAPPSPAPAVLEVEGAGRRAWAAIRQLHQPSLLSLAYLTIALTAGHVCHITHLQEERTWSEASLCLLSFLMSCTFSYLDTLFTSMQWFQGRGISLCNVPKHRLRL